MAAASPRSAAVEPPQLDIGEDVVAPYLWERSFRTVDVVALSHAHEDHIGGLPAIVADFHPKELWTGATPESRLLAQSARQAQREGRRQNRPHDRAAPVRLRRRRRSKCSRRLPITFPPIRPRTTIRWCMRIRYGRRTFLLCGDVERPIERRMLAENEIAHADVLKVAHHGSRTSSTEEFLDAASPEFAIISAGFDNSYGHPNRDVLDRLARAPRRHLSHRSGRPDHRPHRWQTADRRNRSGSDAWGFTLPLAVF